MLSLRPFIAVGAFAASLALCPALVAPAQAQAIVFTDVASTLNPEFVTFGAVGPTINNAGTVLFRASKDTTTAGGIFTATDSSSFNTIAVATQTGFTNFGNFLSINSAGEVAFIARSQALGFGIFTATNSSTFNTLALTSNTELTGTMGSVDPVINNAGVVTFRALRDSSAGGGAGIYTATTNSFTTIALTTGSEFSSLGNSSIDDAGIVSFIGDRTNGQGGIYTTTNGSSFNTVATRDASVFSRFEDFGLNNAGVAVVLATGTQGVGTRQGIYTTNSSGGFDTVAQADDANFVTLDNPNINDLGTVVFQNEIHPSVESVETIYAKLSSSADPFAVIRAGDTLFGSKVARVTLAQRALASNSDTVAFRYILENGVEGIAKATIVAAPEPGSIALAFVGGIGLMGTVVRRRKNSR